MALIMPRHRGWMEQAGWTPLYGDPLTGEPVPPEARIGDPSVVEPREEPLPALYSDANYEISWAIDLGDRALWSYPSLSGGADWFSFSHAAKGVFPRSSRVIEYVTEHVGWLSAPWLAERTGNRGVLRRADIHRV